jgi:hypothetical protein
MLAYLQINLDNICVLHPTIPTGWSCYEIFLRPLENVVVAGLG